VKEVYIPHTLETVAEKDECKAVYKLLVRSNLANGQFVVWEELRSQLESSINGQYVMSELNFDATSGDLSAILY
jgi:hypothetical protein